MTIIELFFISSRIVAGASNAGSRGNIRVERVQPRQPVRHENCYSRAGTGTGAHKLRIRCFTCHIPAYPRAQLASRTRPTNHVPGPADPYQTGRVSFEPVRSNISPEAAVTFYPRFRMRHFRQITCRSPTASFFALEIINSGIDEFLLLNLLLWKFNERGTFLRSLRILYIWSSFRLAKKSFEVIGPSWRQKLGSYREMIWKDSRATKGLRDVWMVHREANSVSARVENFHFRKRRAVTVTDSRLAEKYGARAKFCARFTRPD